MPLFIPVRAAVLVLVTSLSLLTACGEAAGPAAPDPAPDAAAVPFGDTLTVNEAGGSLVVGDARGIELRVEIPDGAVVEPVELRITPADRTEGQATRFRIEATDPELLRPARFSLTFPTALEVPDGLEGVLSGDGRSLVVPVDWDEVARTLSFSTRVLGFPAPPPGASPGAARLAGLDPVETVAFMALEELACTVKIQLLQNSLDVLAVWLIQQGLGALALAPIAEVGNLLDSLEAHCLDRAEDWEALKELARQQACQAYEAASDQVQLFLPDTTWARTRKHFVQLAEAEALDQTVGANCGYDYEALVDQAAEKYLEALDLEMSGADVLQGNWSQPFNRLKGIQNVVWPAFELLGVSSAVQAPMFDKLIPGFWDRLFRLGMRRCREQADPRYVADVLNGGGVLAPVVVSGSQPPNFSGLDYDELVAAIQHCGSLMEVAVETPQGILDEVLLPGSDAPWAVSGALPVPSAFGHALRFQGPIPSFKCPLPQEERIVIRGDVILMGGYPVLAELQPDQNGWFLTDALSLTVEAVLDAFALDPADSPAFRIVVERKGAGCGGLFGPEDYELYAVDVATNCQELGASQAAAPGPQGAPEDLQCLEPTPPVTVAVEFAGRVHPDEDVPVTITATTLDGSPVVGAEVILGGSGTSLGSGNGLTDDQGRFETTVRVQPLRNEVEVTAHVRTEEDQIYTGVGTQLRRNELVVRSRDSEGEAYVALRGRSGEEASVQEAYRVRDLDRRTDLAPWEGTFTAVGSGALGGVSASGDVSLSHESRILGTATVLTGFTHQASADVQASLSGSEPELTYTGEARAQSRAQLDFYVWGDPAAFTLSLTQNDESGFYFYGAGIGFCVSGDDSSCGDVDGPVDITEEPQPDGSTRVLASGVLAPGGYNVTSVLNAYVVFNNSVDPEEPETAARWPDTGSGTMNRQVQMTLQLSQGAGVS